MAGALETALELSVRYATERVQFGRKISQFQAIQHELARFAGEVAAAVAAALSAAGALERGENALLAVASAKIRSAHAAHEGALIAHQVHGAIGVTAGTRCIIRRCGCGRGARNSAMKRTGHGARTRSRRRADQLWPTLAAH
jgi:acyl-CoA dehydrogenase